MEARKYCPGCRKWYHLIGTDKELSKLLRDGCRNCGSELLDSAILTRPNSRGDLVLTGTVPPPDILFAPTIETLRDNERIPIDHSTRILNLVFGDDWDGNDLFERITSK